MLKLLAYLYEVYRHGLSVLDEIVDREADGVLLVLLLCDVVVVVVVVVAQPCHHGFLRNVVGSVKRIFPARHVCIFGQGHGNRTVGIGDDLGLDVPVHLVSLQVFLKSLRTLKTSGTKVTFVSK